MHGRLWDEEMILDAFLIKDFGQLGGLSKKVLDGEQLTVLAYGDSITADFSGCYPAGAALNTSASSHPLHWAFHAASLQPSSDPGDGGLRCDRIPNLAWMTSFLTLLNWTWPSKKPHRYVNFGSSASSLQSHAENDCQADFLPKEPPDLLIVEHLPMLYGEGSKKVKLWAEIHLHRIFSHYNKVIPVIYLNLYGFSHGNFPSTLDEKLINYCLSNPPRWWGSPLDTACVKECDPKRSFQGQPKVSNDSNLAEQEVHDVARHYGFASFSHKALLESIVETGALAGHNLTLCQLYSAIFQDSFHPREAGRVLIADALFAYISRGIESYMNSRMPSTGVHDVGSPLVPESMVIPLIHCFLAKETKLRDEVILTRMMDVVKADGWSLVELDGPKHAFKPGWISEQPGSKLQVNIPLAHAHHGNVAHHHQRKTTLLVTYLSSYENMGQGRISCVANCTCQSTLVDALTPKATWSSPSWHRFEVEILPDSSSCLVEIEVQEAADKRTHNKFKVISLQSTTYANVSSVIKALG